MRAILVLALAIAVALHADSVLASGCQDAKDHCNYFATQAYNQLCSSYSSSTNLGQLAKCCLDYRAMEGFSGAARVLRLGGGRGGGGGGREWAGRRGEGIAAHERGVRGRDEKFQRRGLSSLTSPLLSHPPTDPVGHASRPAPVGHTPPPAPIGDGKPSKGSTTGYSVLYEHSRKGVTTVVYTKPKNDNRPLITTISESDGKLTEKYYYDDGPLEKIERVFSPDRQRVQETLVFNVEGHTTTTRWFGPGDTMSTDGRQHMEPRPIFIDFPRPFNFHPTSDSENSHARLQTRPPVNIPRD